MQRVALMSMCGVGLGMGLWLGACGEPPATVDEDTLSWQLSSETNSFKLHAPSKTADFDVACKIENNSVTISIEQAEIADERRPRSILKVSNVNPDDDTCFVTVTEAPRLGDSEYTLTDSCKGTNANGGCVVTGEFNSDGWDFNGTVTCSKLAQRPTDTILTQLSGSVVTDEPVVLKVANCN